MQAVELSPHGGAPSCDVVTDVIGQIDAPFSSRGAGTEMFVVIRCYASTLSSGKSAYPALFIFCQQLPPSTWLLLTDID